MSEATHVSGGIDASVVRLVVSVPQARNRATRVKNRPWWHASIRRKPVAVCHVGCLAGVLTESRLCARRAEHESPKVQDERRDGGVDIQPRQSERGGRCLPQLHQRWALLRQPARPSPRRLAVRRSAPQAQTCGVWLGHFSCSCDACESPPSVSVNSPPGGCE
eukprot:6311385-Pyramimonas_sp.AAC.1